jgi:hypothetical protein
VSAGLGLLGAAGLAGCAASAKGDFMPRSGRRVIVVGGGWGDTVQYDVINLIPRAGAIAGQADLVGADRRWCEVASRTGATPATPPSRR